MLSLTLTFNATEFQKDNGLCITVSYRATLGRSASPSLDKYIFGEHLRDKGPPSPYSVRLSVTPDTFYPYGFEHFEIRHFVLWQVFRQN